MTLVAVKKYWLYFAQYVFLITCKPGYIFLYTLFRVS